MRSRWTADEWVAVSSLFPFMSTWPLDAAIKNTGRGTVPKLWMRRSGLTQTQGGFLSTPTGHRFFRNTLTAIMGACSLETSEWILFSWAVCSRHSASLGLLNKGTVRGQWPGASDNSNKAWLYLEVLKNIQPPWHSEIQTLLTSWHLDIQSFLTNCRLLFWHSKPSDKL